MDVDPISHSLGFAALVSALETLVAFEHHGKDVERCSTCGQERHRVTKKFQDFVIKYGYQDPRFQKQAQKLYSVRSKILHEGRLRLADDPRHPFWEMYTHGGPGSIDAHAPYAEAWQHGELVALARICFVHWLLSHHTQA